MAQQMFINQALVDEDEDGMGEWAPDFETLNKGVETMKGSYQPMLPPDFKVGENPQYGEKNGYCFLMFLKISQVMNISSGGKESLEVEENQMRFACLAWPRDWPGFGRYAFAITDYGVVYEHLIEEGRFNGLQKPMRLADVFGKEFDDDTIGKGRVNFIPSD